MFNELSPRKQQFLREVFDPSLNIEQRQALLNRYGYNDLGVEGIQSVIGGMTGAVAKLSTPLPIGWVTPELVSVLDLSGMEHFLKRGGSTLSALEVLYKLNRLEDFSDVERQSLYQLGYAGGNDSFDTSELELRRANILVPVAGGVAGSEYVMDLDEARKVADFAVNGWRKEQYGAYSDDYVQVRGDERYRVALQDRYVSIGCQRIAQVEVTRIAALFGWGGLTKQEGPKLEQQAKVAEPA
jgi:hypothetical protein